MRLGKGITARLTTKSNFSFISSTRDQTHVTFVKPNAWETWVQTLIFLAMLSTSRKLHCGKSIAKGMPGKPPPVPTSITVVEGRNVSSLAMASE